MAAPKFKDLSSGTLSESISASTTTLKVYVGDGSAATIVSVWPSTPFYASILPANPSAGVANSLDSEIVKVTAVSTDQVGNTTLTVVRAQRGTTGKAFDAGSVVTGGIYAEDAVIYDDTSTAVTPEPWIDTGDIKNNAITTDKITNSAVTTNKIANSAVTANKIDFTTFPHIIKAGTQTFPAVGGGRVQDVSISIPTQTNTNYVVVATHSATVNNWTWLAIQSLNKTTTSFTLRVANNSNNTTGTPSVDYIVVKY